MLPPCDPTILESNPQFKKLYQELTSSILNPDGSTRANDALPEREAAVDDLRQCRVRSAKRNIKKRTLHRLAFDSDSELPDEYRHVVGVISLYLDSSPIQDAEEKEDTLTLLNPDIEKFHASIPAIIPPFSSAITTTISSLRTIANAGTNQTPPAPAAEPPRYRLRARQSIPRATATPLLSTQLKERVRKLREMQLTEIPASRAQMAVVAAAAFATGGQVLEMMVMLLERAKHGALARAIKAQAEYLASLAQAAVGKLSLTKLDALNEIYTPQALSALEKYRQHLREVHSKLEERHASAVEELKNYETVETDGSSGGGSNEQRESGPMAEIIRRYGALAQEVEAVKTEIRRLE